MYSPFAREWGLQRSLPERLFDHYEATGDETFKNANVMFLTENYRSHQEILNFPSENFYGGQLVARGHANQPAHPRLGPLVFYTARGKEEKDHDHSFMNLAEVDEVVKRVKELAGDWPTKEWGEMDLSQIAVLAAYRYQVQCLLITNHKLRITQTQSFTKMAISNSCRYKLSETSSGKRT